MNLPDLYRLSQLAAVFLLLVVHAIPASTQTNSITPADFEPGGFVGIELSGSDIAGVDGNIIIPCQAIIDINGFPSNYNCKTNSIDEHGAFLRAVINALPGQIFQPAMLDGNPVRVLMDFSVIFRCENGSCVNAFTRNHLHHYKEFGLAYVAPQPIITDDEWYDGFENKTSWARELRLKLDEYSNGSDQQTNKTNFYDHYYPGYVFSAEVTTDGSVAATEVSNLDTRQRRVSGSRLTRSAREDLVDITELSFIPGFHNGKPETMQFIEATMARLETPVTNEATQGDIYVPDPTNVNEAAWRTVTEGRY